MLYLDENLTDILLFYRLMMICDYRQNGCLDKVMSKQYDTHVKNCGYKMKTCKFLKCGQNILRRNLETHMLHSCKHRLVMCEGECGLMIPLSEKPSHNCVAALKAHIEGMILLKDYCTRES